MTNLNEKKAADDFLPMSKKAMKRRGVEPVRFCICHWGRLCGPLFFRTGNYQQTFGGKWL